MKLIILILLLILSLAVCAAGVLVLALFGWLDCRTHKNRKMPLS
jgi:hypothetical protein